MSPQRSPDRPSILVVDDDPDVRGMLGIVLNHAGYEVMTAVDGADALGLARDDRIGLILLDIHMPRLEGNTFCRVYREHGGKVPIVVITAAEIDSDVVARCGANAFIAKPFDIDVLLRTVADQLRGR